ncbi:hypothetical protein OGAPHI_002088 [Ogataea philodendri]|uniref:Translation initiation factor eIF2B subunit beta n=1 Tax=Ogataea philodendri TaxID=1378263 RepID=A0A9P8PBC3_9ASCO|nr:uncharacterized protein OGAPHI_002088 [Ogataea philodendri]KAH3668334.1 hypothetical protein OGAPHI_002088 [Ogataea philodendri]
MSSAQKYEVFVDSFISKLKRRQVTGSYNVATATCRLLMRVISSGRWSSTAEFIELIRGVGTKLIEAQPREFAAGNIVRRVLAIIRDEVSETTATDMANNAPYNTSMFQLLSTTQTNKNPSNQLTKQPNQDLRSVVIQGIRELIDEIASVHENIELMTVDLIHENEVLLTPTPGSQTVLNFLLKASLKRKFTVLITESYPNDIQECHKFAEKLAKMNIETVIIPDSSVFAVMSRVGKVLIGARSVFANGGCVTAAGVATVCECAKEHRTPVFAVAGLYKFSPTYPFDRDSLIEVGNSGRVLPYEDSDLVGKCEVTNPLFDYVVPEHIDIYITNIGGFSPNFIYRIVLDNYKAEDTFGHLFRPARVVKEVGARAEVHKQFRVVVGAVVALGVVDQVLDVLCLLWDIFLGLDLTEVLHSEQSSVVVGSVVRPRGGRNTGGVLFVAVLNSKPSEKNNLASNVSKVWQVGVQVPLVLVLGNESVADHVGKLVVLVVPGAGSFLLKRHNHKLGRMLVDKAVHLVEQLGQFHRADFSKDERPGTEHRAQAALSQKLPGIAPKEEPCDTQQNCGFLQEKDVRCWCRRTQISTNWRSRPCLLISYGFNLAGKTLQTSISSPTGDLEWTGWTGLLTTTPTGTSLKYANWASSPDSLNSSSCSFEKDSPVITLTSPKLLIVRSSKAIMKNLNGKLNHRLRYH